VFERLTKKGQHVPRGSDRDWEVWGKTDPYFAVVSHPKFRKAELATNLEEFWHQGEIEIEKVVRRYELAFGPLSKGRALDFGCGVGRLTLPLAKRFSQVVAVDISPSMLAELTANVARAGLDNVDGEISDDRLSRISGTFDFVVSVIVLQHVPLRRGLAILERLIAKINSGGGCHLHLSVHRRASALVRVGYWVRDNVPFARPIMNLLVGLPMSQPGMQMNAYPVNSVLDLFQRAGMNDIQVTLSDHGKVLTAAFTARKPSGAI
jgi:SAM-dependent methyltransferase